MFRHVGAAAVPALCGALFGFVVPTHIGPDAGPLPRLQIIIAMSPVGVRQTPGMVRSGPAAAHESLSPGAVACVPFFGNGAQHPCALSPVIIGWQYVSAWQPEAMRPVSTVPPKGPISHAALEPPG